MLMTARSHIPTYIHTGFFPAEMVFTERAIPVLVKQGIEWVIVANNHISRACKVRGSFVVVVVVVVVVVPPSPHPLIS